MIVFDLECRTGGHRFEGWFGDSADFAAQADRGLVCCPVCGGSEVAKAPMAPRLGKKGNQLASAAKVPVAGGALPPEAAALMHKLAEMQSAALEGSTWVGDTFAEASRAMHYGERERETIHGQATRDEAAELHEEGIAVMPLPFPVAPPDSLN